MLNSNTKGDGVKVGGGGALAGDEGMRVETP